MDTAIAAAIAALVAGSPNLVVAIWMLSRQDKRIDELLTAQKWLIEQLMALHPPQPPKGESHAPDERND
jgi:uncharacterized membrane protein YbaN (DUF454 family)